MSINNGTQTLESMSQAVWYNRWTVSKFENYLKGQILEVGCGIGNFTEILAKYGEVFAIDIDRNNLEACRTRVKNKARVELGNIETGANFFKGNKFDTVVCLNVLEHINDDGRALTNIYNLLKKDGLLILLVPVHKFLYGEIDKSIGHYRRYDKEDILNTLKNKGYKIINKRILNMLGAVGWFFSARLLKNAEVEKNKVKVFDFFAPFLLPLEDIIEPPFGTSMLIIAQKIK